jgi:hypothetical protein
VPTSREARAHAWEKHWRRQPAAGPRARRGSDNRQPRRGRGPARSPTL